MDVSSDDSKEQQKSDSDGAMEDSSDGASDMSEVFNIVVVDINITVRVLKEEVPNRTYFRAQDI